MDPARPTLTWPEVLDHISTAFTAGYDVGYARGRNDKIEDDLGAAVHEYACCTIGLTPHDGPPLWAIAT